MNTRFMHYRSPWVLASVVVLLGACSSLSRTTPHCSLGIKVAGAPFEREADVVVHFGPSREVSVTVAESSPEALAATLDARAAVSVHTLPKGTRTRKFFVDSPLWTAAWDKLGTRDHTGIFRMPAGWYQIQLVYSEERRVNAGTPFCVVLSEPFQLLTESSWMHDY